MSPQPTRRRSRILPFLTATLTAALSLVPTISDPSAEGLKPHPRQLAKGKFLVAGHDLLDPNFRQTVVLLLEYSSEGALGLVVNRPTEMKLGVLLADDEELADSDETVYLGGPVMEGHMLMLVRADSEPAEARRVMDEVFYSGSRELLGRLTGQGEDHLRVFAGHAGWGPGQLDWEVERGGWYILSAHPEEVFDEDPRGLWEKMIRRTSGLLARGERDRMDRISVLTRPQELR